MDIDKIKLQLLRAELRKKTKLEKERATLSKGPIILRGTNWTLTLDEYEEQESWRRKIPDDGNIERGDEL
jgi:hypothetical protein